MEATQSGTDAKYHKLAQEYAKLRAQATVLKKAVVEEQSKGGQLKETIRLKEVDLRRSEQEVDSLSFRNRQLELRVATLQSELEQAQGKQKKSLKSSSNGHGVHNSTSNSVNNNISHSSSSSAATTGNAHSSSNGDPQIVAEEFQKKIIENAQLISLLSDKSQELEACQQSLRQLEEQVNSRLFKQSFAEEGLRQELRELSLKNAELEVKLLEAGKVGALPLDEDNRSVTTENSSILADTAPISTNAEDRVVALEKELIALQAKVELLSMQGKEAAIAASDTDTDPISVQRVEEVLFGHFSQKMDEVLLEKQLAESRLASYLTECDSLRDHLEILTDQLRDQERHLGDSQATVKRVEDQLQTTRTNYEQQITVLTEQVLLLSDQLAAASH